MAAPFLTGIDWSRPWLAHVQAIGQEVASAADWREALNARAGQRQLTNRRGLPVRFVPQADLPAGVAYETFIHDTGCVPTRDNLHDFFNALVWLTFPQVKVQLNALQAAEIEKSRQVLSGEPDERGDAVAPATGRTASMRGKVRDAATIFDENAALLVTADQALVEALRTHAWQDAFVTRGAAFWQSSRVFLFGHALMEKLVMPYKSITGHMWVIGPETQTLSTLPVPATCHQIDDLLAKRLEQGLTTSEFSPLPILGLPGWWPEQGEDFYQDTTVFRPRRT